MATKRQTSASSDTSHQGNAAKRRLQFSEDQSDMGVMPAAEIDQTGEDLLNQAGGVSVDQFDGAAALAAMESGSGTHQPQESMIREQDRFLPIGEPYFLKLF